MSKPGVRQTCAPWHALRRKSVHARSLPALLLSMPQLLDPNFARTVVLLCKHSDEGAFGLVVNRPLVTTGRVVVNLDPPVSTDRELEVWVGGPVEPERSWMLVGGDAEGEATSRAGCALPTGCTCRRRPTCCAGCWSRLRRPTRRLIVGYSAGGRVSSKPSSKRRRGSSATSIADLIFDTPAGADVGDGDSPARAQIPATLQMSRGVH